MKILFALLALSVASLTQAQTCPATVCVNVGDPIVFTIVAPATGPTPDGYNLLSGANLASIQTLATANTPGPGFLSLGSALSYSTTATNAMLGTTSYAANDWSCATTPCAVSALSNLVTVKVSVPSVVILPLQPPSLTVK